MDCRATAASRPPSFLPVFLVALAGFAVGALAERNGWLPGSAGREPPGLARTFAPFWETWRLVQAHYVDRAAVKPERMTEGAIEGMLDCLGDRGHTTYLTAKEYEQMESGLKGEMEGIGARMSLQHGHQATVMGVVPHSPAEKAGLRAGDIFLEVDGKDVTDMSLERIVSLVRGPAGQKVHLQVFRECKKLDFDITVVSRFLRGLVNELGNKKLWPVAAVLLAERHPQGDRIAQRVAAGRLGQPAAERALAGSGDGVRLTGARAGLAEAHISHFGKNR